MAHGGIKKALCNQRVAAELANESSSFLQDYLKTYGLQCEARAWVQIYGDGAYKVFMP